MKIIDSTTALAKAIIIILLEGILMLVSMVFYPIPYLFRKPVRALKYAQTTPLKIIRIITFPVWFLLWIFLDDGNGSEQWNDYGNQHEGWEQAAKLFHIPGLKPDTAWHKFLCAWYWSGIRNPTWNIYTFPFMQRPQGKAEIIYAKVWKGTADALTMKRFKFVSADGVTSNEGQRINWTESITGASIAFFTIGGTRLMLISVAVVLFYRKGKAVTWEFNFGMASRWLIRNKIKAAYP